MKELVLTYKNQRFVALVDDEDFPIISRFNWSILKSRGGLIYYAAHWSKGSKPILMHRLILGITDSSVKVDHRNHDGLDNQKANLRRCTHSQNLFNSRKHVASSSQYKGVYRETTVARPWRARLRVQGFTYELGRFATENEAAEAYNSAAVQHCGEFASLNHIVSD